MHHYLDGELTVWRRWYMRRHLNKCPPCADGFVYEVEFRMIIAERCREQTPDDLRQRICGAIGFESQSEEGEAQRSAGRTAGSAERSRPEEGDRTP